VELPTGEREGVGCAAMALGLRQRLPLAFRAEDIVAAVELDDGHGAVLVSSCDLAVDDIGEMQAKANFHSFAEIPRVLFGESSPSGVFDCYARIHLSAPV